MCAPTQSKTSGDPAYVGSGAGKGYTINVGWNNGVHPCVGYGDEEYFACFQRVLLPVARAFAPDVVLISAGFDSAAGDECGYAVTPQGYAQLTHMLQADSLPSAQGRVVCVLEGGYNLPAVAYGLEACLCALLRPEAEWSAKKTSSSQGVGESASPLAVQDMQARIDPCIRRSACNLRLCRPPSTRSGRTGGYLMHNFLIFFQLNECFK